VAFARKAARIPTKIGGVVLLQNDTPFVGVCPLLVVAIGILIFGCRRGPASVRAIIVPTLVDSLIFVLLV
jgi:hypothetical protein